MDGERLNVAGWLATLIALTPFLALMAILGGQELWERLTRHRARPNSPDDDQKTSVVTPPPAKAT